MRVGTEQLLKLVAQNSPAPAPGAGSNSPEGSVSDITTLSGSSSFDSSYPNSAVNSSPPSPVTTQVGRFTIKKVDSPSVISNEVPLEVELAMCRAMVASLQKEKEKLSQEVSHYRETNYERLMSENKKREVTSGFWRGGICQLDEINMAGLYCFQCKKKFCRKCSTFVHHYPSKHGHKLVKINSQRPGEEERNYRIMLQGFNWESSKLGNNWYKIVEEKVNDMKSLGITTVWLPPPSESCSSEGYMPGRYYNLNSQYGTYEDLKLLLENFHKADIEGMADIVINHRTAQEQSKSGRWNVYKGMMAWDSRAIVGDQPDFGGKGNRKSDFGAEVWGPAPNIDHSQEFVREDIIKWMNWLRLDVGYDCFRFDYVKGYWGGYLKEYIEHTMPSFCVGELWTTMEYADNGAVEYNQDYHRQKLVDWIDSTDGNSAAFDFTTKGVLMEALNRTEYWRLRDVRSSPPGLIGWYPSRAVTFLDNHDTGSTQGHWPFPSHKILQGYAYIMTHSGIPCVFWDHLYDWGPDNAKAIRELIAIRRRNKLHAESKVYIEIAEAEVYAATIDNRVAMKIGPKDWAPTVVPDSLPGVHEWVIASFGEQYAVWELKKIELELQTDVATTSESVTTTSNEEEDDELISKLNTILSMSRSQEPSSASSRHRRTPSLQAFTPNW